MTRIWEEKACFLCLGWLLVTGWLGLFCWDCGNFVMFKGWIVGYRTNCIWEHGKKRMDCYCYEERENIQYYTICFFDTQGERTFESMNGLLSELVC